MRLRSTLVICGIAGVVSALDLWSKNWALGFLQGSCMYWPPFILEFSAACGMPYSDPADTWVLAWLAAFAVLAILWVSRRVAHRWWRVGLGMLMGGLIGDLIDRLARPPGFGSGKAVRFMASTYLPTLNLAYCAIFFGLTLIGALALLGVDMRLARRRP